MGEVELHTRDELYDAVCFLLFLRHCYFSCKGQNMNHTPANLSVSKHEGQSVSPSLQGTKDNGSLVPSSAPQPTHILKFTDTLLTFDF